MGATGTVRDCSTEAADWCGQGQCTEVADQFPGVGIGNSSVTAYHCVCDEGWRGSVLELDPKGDPARCMLSIPLMRTFFSWFLASTLFQLAMTVKGVRFERRRYIVLVVAYVINALLSVAALSMPETGPNSTLGRFGGAVLFASGTCSVLLFGPIETLLLLNKYVLVNKANAAKLRGQDDVDQTGLAPETVSAMAICFVAWGICCVIWAVAPTSNRSAASCFFATVGASVTTLGWFTATSIKTLDQDLAFLESQVTDEAMLSKLAVLRSKMSQTRVSVIGPCVLLAAVTFFGAVISVVPSAFPSLSQQVDYVWFFWVIACVIVAV
jgi:hypothetical protein